MYEHVCLTCGKKFTTKYNEIRKYCSNSCYQKAPKKRIWNRDKVIENIKEIANQGIDLNAVNIRDNYLPLFKAARRYFGNWNNALIKSGYNPNQIRKDRKTESFKGLVFQNTLDKIFKALDIGYLKGTNYTFTDERCVPDFVSKDKKTWGDAKIRSWTVGIEETIKKYLRHIDKIEIFYIGGGPRNWDSDNVKFTCVKDYFPDLKKINRDDLIKEINLLEKKSGVDQKHWKVWSEKWSKEKIIEGINQLNKNGFPLNYQFVRDHNRDLLAAAVQKKYFGSWKNAIEQAGLDYISVRKNKYLLSKKAVIEEIKNRAKNGNLSGLYLGGNTKNKRLYHSARKHFGSMKNAVESAGLKKDSYRVTKEWSRDLIIDALKEHSKNGKHLSYSNLRKIDKTLIAAIDSGVYFKGLVEARKVAKVENNAPKREYWSKDKVIKRLQLLHTKGIRLTKENIYQNDSRLASAIDRRTYFKTLSDAKRSAGFE